jgi:hypothetical protein
LFSLARHRSESTEKSALLLWRTVLLCSSLFSLIKAVTVVFDRELEDGFDRRNDRAGKLRPLEVARMVMPGKRLNNAPKNTLERIGQREAKNTASAAQVVVLGCVLPGYRSTLPQQGDGVMLDKSQPLNVDYVSLGYFIARQIIPPSQIDGLLSKFVGLVNSLSGQSFRDAHDPQLAAMLSSDRALQSKAYDEVRRPDWLLEFSKSESLVSSVRDLLGPRIALMSKIPFRTDVPLDTKELAVWHQDYFYVKGNTDIVTAWIPMQNTNYLNGCLSVMPGSHKLGPVEHDGVTGKRHFPTKHLGGEIRLVEMQKGDVLFFHSALLHTGNINLSNSIRYSVQARYSLAGQPTDKGMGEAIQL